MKVLVCSTPATGHINPLLAIAGMVMAEGHDVAMLSGTAFRDRIESSGAQFLTLPGVADFDGRNIVAVIPELQNLPPGPDWLRTAIERLFVDRIPAQHQGLKAALKSFPADVIIGDDMFFGVLPMLLGRRESRPAIVLCGTSFLHWERADRAPHFLGLPPAKTRAQFEAYDDIIREHAERVEGPLSRKLDSILKGFGLRSPQMTLFDSVVKLADTYLQLSVPSFEFPREIPASVRFIGSLPILANQVPLPSWASELDGTRKVVLVTQGTVANHNFGLLVSPTLTALANEPDILVVATAGGRSIDAIPGVIPANARVADYLPFDWLLNKVDLMVTNGGYGSVNQALSFGIPIVAAGLTEDKADVNVRIAWSGAGIDLMTNEPTPESILAAVRAGLDQPSYRQCAKRLASEFAAYDARAEVSAVLRSYDHPASGGTRIAAA